MSTVPRTLPLGLRRWLQERIVWDPSLENPAAVQFKDGKYKILLHPLFDKFNDETKRIILLHEVLHVVRGDIIRAQRDNLSSESWNIATDAVINRDLTIDQLASFQSDKNWHKFGLTDNDPKGIIYDNLLNSLGIDSNCLISASDIYELIHNHELNWDEYSGDLDINGSDRIEAVDQIKETSGLQEELHKAGVRVPKQKSGARAGRNPGDGEWTPEQKNLHRILIQLNKSINRIAYLRQRSWRRERQSLIPHRIPQRNWQIDVYADLSGSTSPYWETIGAICRYLKAKYDARIRAFDTMVYAWDGYSKVRAGGGTLWNPITQDARKNSCIVVITDGGFVDQVTFLDNVTWILFPGCNSPVSWGKVIFLKESI